MEFTIEILKMLVPTIAVVLVMYLILKSHQQKELKILSLILQEKKQVASPQEAIRNNSIVLPSKLKAYEAMALFMEKIEPSSIVMRIHKPGMSAKLLHADILRGIREEFESNVSQQIYISGNAWELIKQAKEETVKIINISFQKMEEDSTGIDLSREIFETMMKAGQSPSGIALNYIHKEVEQLIH